MRHQAWDALDKLLHFSVPVRSGRNPRSNLSEDVNLRSTFLTSEAEASPGGQGCWELCVCKRRSAVYPRVRLRYKRIALRCSRMSRRRRSVLRSNV